MDSRFDLLLHPVRLQVLHAFGGGHLVLTHDELVARLAGMSRTALEKHLGILMEQGVIEETGDGPETRYRVRPGAAVIEQGDILRATPADHLRYFTTLVAGLIENFARYLRRPNVDIADARVSYRQVTLHLTREELATLIDEMEELLQRDLKKEPGNDRRAMVLTRIIMPEVLADEDE